MEDERKIENEENKEESQVMWMPICMCFGVSIGMCLGKKVSTNREHLVMDGDCEYMEDNVDYNVDSDDRVECMVFHRVEDSSGEELYDLSNINLFYRGEHLDTTEKVIACYF